MTNMRRAQARGGKVGVPREGRSQLDADLVIGVDGVVAAAGAAEVAVAVGVGAEDAVGVGAGARRLEVDLQAAVVRHDGVGRPAEVGVGVGAGRSTKRMKAIARYRHEAVECVD